jgi:hypothetical protein
MLKMVKRWIYYYKQGKKAKKYLQEQIEIVKSMGKAEPPTPEELEAFKKEIIWR